MKEGFSYKIATLGCKANFSDSQVIEESLRKEGGMPVRRDQSADICVVNTCAVTQEATKQSKKLAAKLRNHHPHAKILITGCASEVSPQEFKTESVVGNRRKSTIGKTLTQNIEEPKWELPVNPTQGNQHSNQTARTRVFLKIQEGCESFCTFCIIPYGRGPKRNLESQEIVRQIQNLVLQEGVQEIVLTGTNVGEYQGEGQRDLGDLIQQILAETSLQRLRVSSLDPLQITDSIFEIAEKEKRFCPHFHVSLQSPHSLILRRMKRKYKTSDVEKCLYQIQETGEARGESFFVGMDVITGFPGETQEIFEESYALLEKLPWSRLHVFPYSEREGTAATRFPKKDHVEVAQRKIRAQKLRELSLRKMESHYRKIFTTHEDTNRPLGEVLLEGPCRGPDGSRNWIGGYSPQYLRVLIPSLKKSAPESFSEKITALQLDGIAVQKEAGEVLFLGREIHT